jgi:hypothetical protein
LPGRKKFKDCNIVVLTPARSFLPYGMANADELQLSRQRGPFCSLPLPTLP